MKEIRKGWRAAAAIAAVATLAGGPVFGIASPAQASPADCQGGANGFRDIPDTMSGTVQRSVPLGPGVTVTLESGPVAGATRGWAKVSGNTLQGDEVWMDWSTDGGKNWLQCGPFAVDAAGKSKTSAAKETNPSPAWQFRACGRGAGFPIRCTTWW